MSRDLSACQSNLPQLSFTYIIDMHPLNVLLVTNTENKVVACRPPAPELVDPDGLLKCTLDTNITAQLQSLQNNQQISLEFKSTMRCVVQRVGDIYIWRIRTIARTEALFAAHAQHNSSWLVVSSFGVVTAMHQSCFLDTKPVDLFHVPVMHFISDADLPVMCACLAGVQSAQPAVFDVDWLPGPPELHSRIHTQLVSTSVHSTETNNAAESQDHDSETKSASLSIDADHTDSQDQQTEQAPLKDTGPYVKTDKNIPAAQKNNNTGSLLFPPASKRDSTATLLSASPNFNNLQYEQPPSDFVYPQPGNHSSEGQIVDESDTEKPLTIGTGMPLRRRNGFVEPGPTLECTLPSPPILNKRLIPSTTERKRVRVRIQAFKLHAEILLILTPLAPARRSLMMRSAAALTQIVRFASVPVTALTVACTHGLWIRHVVYLARYAHVQTSHVQVFNCNLEIRALYCQSVCAVPGVAPPSSQSLAARLPGLLVQVLTCSPVN